jgi:peptidoglycan/LPS O-acetylase OafA/YrhL
MVATTTFALPRGGRLPSLTGMRFLAAFAVFGFHVDSQKIFERGGSSKFVDAIFGQGAVGVSFFFILSGFVLTWSARPGVSAAQIWRRRAARIVPSHIAAFLLALLGLIFLSVHDIEPWTVVLNLLLLQAWIPNEKVYFSLNVPSWSLSCETFFYAMFPILLRLINRLNERRLWLTASLLMIAIIAMPVVEFFTSPSISYWLVYIFPVTRAFEFALGMTMARIVLSNRWIGLKLGPATGLMVGSYIGSCYLSGAFAYVAGTAVAFALLIPAAAVSDLTERKSLWRSKLLVWLGELSFAFYIMHHLVIRFVGKAFVPPNGLSISKAVAGSFIMLVFTILCAWVLHRFVERPIYRSLTRRRTDSIPEVAV